MSSEAISTSTSTSTGAGKLWYLIITAIVLALDQLTKYLVSVNFTEGDGGKEIIHGFFKISYTENPGIAFGMLNHDNVRWLLVVVSVAAILVVIYYMMRARASSRLLMWSLALLAAGIAGNLIDRIRLGRVIDFILLYFKTYEWPVFNVADTAITIGAALMAIELFIAPHADKAAVTAEGEPTSDRNQESEVRGQESELS
jgi:signal peptidase II